MGLARPGPINNPWLLVSTKNSKFGEWGHRQKRIRRSLGSYGSGAQLTTCPSVPTCATWMATCPSSSLFLHSLHPYPCTHSDWPFTVPFTSHPLLPSPLPESPFPNGKRTSWPGSSLGAPQRSQDDAGLLNPPPQHYLVLQAGTVGKSFSLPKAQMGSKGKGGSSHVLGQGPACPRSRPCGLLTSSPALCPLL